MKKVLVILYYWPPSGGGGVQRWLKFAKYLPEYGWKTVVVKPANPEYPDEDPSLLEEVREDQEFIEIPIWEPYSAFRKLTGKNKDYKVGAGLSTPGKKGLLDKFGIWVRGNFFIPDARKFWVKPSIKKLSEYLKEEEISGIITTGPPHSLHLIGLGLKKRFPDLFWIADMRDPWTGIDFFPELMLTPWAKKKHQRQEKLVLSTADHVVGVTPTNSKEYASIGGSEITTITNGFDPADHANIDVKLEESFSIAHIGYLMANRDPHHLWEALGELVNENKDFAMDFSLKLIGKVDSKVKESIKSHGLEEYVAYLGYLPHEEAIRHQKESRALLLIINKTGSYKAMIPGKLFEYISSGRPVLLLGPTDGDSANIIRETKTGLISDISSTEKIKENILVLYRHYKDMKDVSLGISPQLEQYSRQNLSKRMAALLDRLAGNG